MADETGPVPRRRYVWPGFVLAALLFGLALAIVWIIAAVHDVRERRDPNAYIPPDASRTGVTTNAVKP